MPTFIVPNDIEIQPVKNYLRKHEGISLTLWRKIKQNNTLQINDMLVNPGMAMVKGTDCIRYEIEHTSQIVPVELPLNICYEDEYLIVIDKPAGQLVHPTTKEHYNTLANGILFYYQQKGLPLSFHPVHRLDKDTSGLVLIAKMPHIQHLFSFTQPKTLKRIYQALVLGIPTPSEALINAPIDRKPDSIIERMVAETGQEALTHYKTIKNFQTFSLLEVELMTGRTHQIRVHLSYIGHPILGDDLYGGPTNLIHRQALHAKSLSFIHPVTKQKIEVISRLSKDIQNIINTQ